MLCECCGKEFKNSNALTVHMQHRKNCYQFYIKKYEHSSNFPWKRTSETLNKNCIVCEICFARCIGQMGISKHILQHSPKCLVGYELKYGLDRTNWPKQTYLKIRTCFDCGAVLKDPRSKMYCANCYSTTHNYAKRPEAAKKQSQYMLNGGAVCALLGVTNPSKPQIELFKIIQEITPYPFLEYPCLNKSIDIAIPCLSIAIEYDGSYWHQDSKSDELRQSLLEDEGWRFIRYIDRIPTKEEIIYDINSIL